MVQVVVRVSRLSRVSNVVPEANPSCVPMARVSMDAQISSPAQAATGSQPQQPVTHSTPAQPMNCVERHKKGVSDCVNCHFEFGRADPVWALDGFGAGWATDQGAGSTTPRSLPATHKRRSDSLEMESPLFSEEVQESIGTTANFH